MPRSPSRKLVVLPSRSIRQADLLALVQIENDLARLLRERDQITNDIIGRLQADVTVEPGIYTAEVVETIRAGKRVTKLRLS